MWAYGDIAGDGSATSIFRAALHACELHPARHHRDCIQTL